MAFPSADAGSGGEGGTGATSGGRGHTGDRFTPADSYSWSSHGGDAVRVATMAFAPQEMNVLTKAARGFALYARHAIRVLIARQKERLHNMADKMVDKMVHKAIREHLQRTMYNYQKMHFFRPQDMTSKEFGELKSLLQLSSKELKKSIEATSKEQKALFEKLSATNAKEIEKVFRQLESLTKEVESSLTAGSQNRKLYAENSAEIIALLKEISSLLKKATPANPSVFSDRLKRMSDFPMKARSFYEQVSLYLVILGGILLCLDALPALTEDQERLVEKFLPDNSPGCFEEMCQESKDLLHKDFAPEFSIITKTINSEGVVINSCCKRSEPQADSSFIVSCFDKSNDVFFDVSSGPHIRTKLAFPGVFGPCISPKACLAFPFRGSSVNLDAIYQNAALRGNLSWHPVGGDRLLTVSGMFGLKIFNAGGLLLIDSGNPVLDLKHISLGCSMSRENFSLGVQFNRKDQVLLMLHHKLEAKSMNQEVAKKTLGKDLFALLVPSPVSQTSLAAEVTHTISKASTVVTVGVEYVDPMNRVKVRLADSGILSALWNMKLFGSSWLSLKAEVNVRDFSAKPGLGVGLSLSL